MKAYRRHNCRRSHKTYRTLARCMFPRAAWIEGEGPIALLAWCDVLTVSLHLTQSAALEDKEVIDASACGGQCTGRHEVVKLVLPELEPIA